MGIYEGVSVLKTAKKRPVSKDNGLLESEKGKNWKRLSYFLPKYFQRWALQDASTVQQSNKKYKHQDTGQHHQKGYQRRNKAYLKDEFCQQKTTEKWQHDSDAAPQKSQIAIFERCDTKNLFVFGP